MSPLALHMPPALPRRGPDKIPGQRVKDISSSLCSGILPGTAFPVLPLGPAGLLPGCESAAKARQSGSRAFACRLISSEALAYFSSP